MLYVVPLFSIYGGFVQKGLEANKMWEKPRILCPKISVGSFTRIFFQLAYCLLLHVLNYRQDRKLTLKHLIFPTSFQVEPVVSVCNGLSPT